jgi:hypothetical protein
MTTHVEDLNRLCARVRATYVNASVANMGGNLYAVRIPWEFGKPDSGGYFLATNHDSPDPGSFELGYYPEEEADVPAAGMFRMGLDADGVARTLDDWTEDPPLAVRPGNTTGDLLAMASKMGRVRLVRDVDRYPHFIAKRGSVGTVIAHMDTAGDGHISVKLDDHLPGAEEWNNEVIWDECWDGLLDFFEDVEALP